MAPKQSEVPNFTVGDYVKFFSAGALAATSTHGVGCSASSHEYCTDLQAVTPIDVVKTRIQVDDALKGYNMIKAGRSIVANEGA